MRQRFKEKRFKYLVILFVLALAGLMAGWQLEKERSSIAYSNEYHKNNLIRFHVLAHSNSAPDQLLKYQVRDVIIDLMAGRFQNAGDIDRARQITVDSLEDIKDAAEHHIRAQGYDYPVQVTLGDYPFPAKTYHTGGQEEGAGDLTLPAGTYEAVRVVIGAGKGANWWCILFPPLCFVDFNHPAAGAAGDGAGEQEEHAAGSPAGSIEYRFKSAEIFDQTKGWFANIFNDHKKKGA